MPNALATQTSPYLLQHADNPVEWHPWGDEALQLARRENKPILLSIGYSACHWCHVMAHESFEDTDVAAVMNRLFVNIKVDREERPDLDQIYQTAHHMLARRSGGWPLTIFLSPDGIPFFSGTYFPKTPRYGLPGFEDLCERIAAAYIEQGEAIAQQNQEVLAALGRTLPEAKNSPEELSDAPLQEAFELLRQNYDSKQGGFGGAPKFPHVSDLYFLLRTYLRTRDENAKNMFLHTLGAMAAGGIFDQLGGGFCRYSVDEKWNIPHFEKMLYDNGPLLALYAEAYALTGESRYRAVVEQTAEWVIREMQAPGGGYYASIDADSEGEEGKFYVWSRDEIKAALSAEEWQLLAPHWGLDAAPNFENHAWHLYIAKPLNQCAQACGMPLSAAQELVSVARAKLFAAREQRIRPGRDDKILTSWNALMIAGMARAAAVFGRQDWLRSAQRALDFINEFLWRDNRLLATCKNGRAHLNAYLDDYAFLMNAILELAQVEFRSADLTFAQQLADVLLAEFEDHAHGGFFFTSHDHEALILRPMPYHDNAMASGNGIAAFGLQRLGLVLGDERYVAIGARCVKRFYAQLQEHPGAMASLLVALQEYNLPPKLVIVRDAQNETVGEQARDWLQKINVMCMPDVVKMHIGKDCSNLASTLNKPVSLHIQAWVCEVSTGNVSCSMPYTRWTDLESKLVQLKG